MNIRRLSTVPLLALLAAPVNAHHSYAMFDQERTRTVEAVVSRFEWRNPHVTLWVYVPRQAAPGYDLYELEGQTVNELKQFGWRHDTPASGERIRVTFFPLRDGRNGGHFIRAVRRDGTVLDTAFGRAFGQRARAQSAAAGRSP